jgi:poly(A) polymerase
MTDDSAASPGDLRVCHQRAGRPPVWTGDFLDGRRIMGFAVICDPDPADQVLVDGDDDLAAPPRRPIPRSGDPRLKCSGPAPDDGLPQQAAQGVNEGLKRQLTAMGEQGDFIKSIFDDVSAEGHAVWLVGGAVRDLVSQGAGARPADLDFTGTIGPGELHTAMRRLKRRVGAGDYEPFISRQLVWAVAPPGGSRKDAFVEYKPLSQPGCRFPAWGGTLACDAGTRDLTINSIYYDYSKHVIIDPTGYALNDLLAVPRIAATPYRGDDPVEQAAVLLRCLKFKLRWPDLDVTAISAWAVGLPADFVTRIPADRWTFLVGLRVRCVPAQHSREDEMAAAVRIAPAAARLIKRIRARAQAGA